MNRTQNTETLLRRYLLGQSIADERSSIERRLMVEQQYLDELTQAEEELIDEYTRGKLDKAEQEQFESLFLNVPERREKVAFAKAFNRYLARHPLAIKHGAPEPLASGAWRRVAVALMAAAVILLAVVSIFLYRKSIQIKDQLASSEAQRLSSEEREKLLSRQLQELQKRNQDMAQELADLKAGLPSGHPTLVTLTLSPGWSRGADASPTVHLSTATKRLRLELLTEAVRYKTYTAEIQTVEGQHIWSGDRFQIGRSGGQQLASIILPSSLFPQGDYLVKLSGTDGNGTTGRVATYYFRATRNQK